MTIRLAVRSLLTRPVRTAVLCCGFGFGIAVMAALLGVGEVILEQAQAPALVGSGDVVITSPLGAVGSARQIASQVLSAPPFAGRVTAVSPLSKAPLYLVRDGRVSRVIARGSLPSRSRAVGDPEVLQVAQWQDSTADARWTSPAPGDLVRAMDRFHPVPDVPARADSWAEWLYFNARSADGTARLYLTFLVGPATSSGRRAAGVRLQLERDGVLTTFGEGVDVDETTILRSAPDLEIGGSSVRLDGLDYRIHLDLPAREGSGRALGDLVFRAVPGRSIPPFTLRGAKDWVSGYTVPILSGPASIDLTASGRVMRVSDAAGYHDHNWGFWRGVTWQWGQVAHGDLSFVFGRVHPPSDAADPARIPGFLGILGPDGPLGYATSVTIEESEEARVPDAGGSGDAGTAASAPGAGAPHSLRIEAHGGGLSLRMEAEIEAAVRSRMSGATGGADPAAMSLIQMRARYRVTGSAAGRAIDFTELGSAETFRGSGGASSPGSPPPRSPSPTARADR
jgi:hypothetical protein